MGYPHIQLTNPEGRTRFSSPLEPDAESISVCRLCHGLLSTGSSRKPSVIMVHCTCPTRNKKPQPWQEQLSAQRQPRPTHILIKQSQLDSNRQHYLSLTECSLYMMSKRLRVQTHETDKQGDKGLEF